MRYQVKEAFDKIIDITSVKPNHLLVTSAIPNDIRLAYIDSEQRTFELKYSDGHLYLLDDIEQQWFPLDNGRY
ncbi:hypothetical protein [Vibrio sp. VB16]|uniref:hypothetical protein n=1 Tax=Vibrio sp. VB16 TaxID=2785746 RepID=UPI00189DC30B|nr:hypothetical protein [Vibrio sp. VB16]UGA53500.1 hypothetical protein IUZ65_009285 [Vibrio sp. VB16]